MTTPRHRLHDSLVKIGTTAVPFHSIVSVDASDIEDLLVRVHLIDGRVLLAYDIDAVELVMQLKPTLVEGHRLRWPKFVWFVHNTLGHPLMQALALVGLHKWAFWVHDATVPTPKGRRRTPRV